MTHSHGAKLKVRTIAELAREAGVSDEELRTISYLEFWARLSARRREFAARDTIPAPAPEMMGALDGGC